MTLALFDLIVDVAVVLSLALLAARFLAGPRPGANAWLAAAICASGICHQLLARQEYGPFMPPDLRITVSGWAAALNLARNAAPGMFMILAHRMFVDGRPTPRWALGLFAVQLLLEIAAYPSRPAWAPPAAPALLQLLFGGLALYWALRHWAGDLVERRRQARAAMFLILTVDMVASSLLLRLVMPLGGPTSYQVHVGLSLLGLAVALGLLFRSLDAPVAPFLDPGREAPAPPVSPTERSLAEDDATLRALGVLMETGQAYLETGITLRGLADRVGVPEYRLRRVIHERLGHRNFNAYLHGLRIAEACRQFDDPAQRRTPILTVALSVGYNSVNTFNRGFREVTGRTPSAYRGEVLARDGRPEPANQPQVPQSAGGLKELASR